MGHLSYLKIRYIRVFSTISKSDKIKSEITERALTKTKTKHDFMETHFGFTKIDDYFGGTKIVDQNQKSRFQKMIYTNVKLLGLFPNQKVNGEKGIFSALIPR